MFDAWVVQTNEGEAVKTISYDDYLRLCGLLALAADHGKALKAIEHSALGITGEQPGSTTSDAVWGGYIYTAAELLDNLEIAVTPAPVPATTPEQVEQQVRNAVNIARRFNDP